MMKLELTHVLVAAAVLAPAQAFAGGFAISETGSRYAGRANAVTAVADSANAVFINPANLTALKGFHAEVGVSLISPSFEYTAVGASEPVDTEPAVFTPPALALSYSLQNLGGWADVAFGLGFSVPYGSSFNWPDNWAGRAAVQQIKLTGFEISPVVAFRPHDKIAIGAGLRIMPIGLYLKRAVGFGDQTEGSVELAGQGTAIGASAGLTAWPLDGLALSFAWRSAGELNAEGDANFKFPAPFDVAAEDMGVMGILPLPQVLRFGVAYDMLDDKLSLSADVQIQLWSTYQELAITLIDSAGAETTTVDPKLSKDSLVLLAGVEYMVTEKLAVRAGYAFDQRTQPEEAIGAAPPDSDRHVITLGASYFFGSFGVHAHVADVLFAERETFTNKMPGTWSGGHVGGATAFIASVGLSAQFGGAEEDK